MTMGLGVFFGSSPVSSLSSSATISAIFLPSGDQAKSTTPPLKSVITCASPPRRSSSQSWSFFLSSVRPERKASQRPSGLKRGVDSLSPLREVSCTVRAPSKLVIQRWVSRLSALVSTTPTV